jgi:hypothetical protein
LTLLFVNSREINFAQTMKSGLLLLVLGVLLLIGAFIVPVLFVLPLILGKTDEVQFKVPGELEFNAQTAGRYYLWNDYETVFHGKTYDDSEKLPDGLDIEVHDANGKELQFTGDSSESVNGHGTSARSIGYVEIDQPGKLKIDVSGETKERVFSFAKSKLMRIFGLISAGVGVAMMAFVISFGLIIWGILKLIKSALAKPRPAAAR